jgi:hypothetical protein
MMRRRIWSPCRRFAEAERKSFSRLSTKFNDRHGFEEGSSRKRTLFNKIPNSTVESCSFIFLLFFKWKFESREAAMAQHKSDEKINENPQDPGFTPQPGKPNF